MVVPFSTCAVCIRWEPSTILPTVPKAPPTILPISAAKIGFIDIRKGPSMAKIMKLKIEILYMYLFVVVVFKDVWLAVLM